MITDAEIKSMHKQFRELEKKIEAYDRIVVYRHTSPDFDALGSQMGLVTWIKENFPQKEVHFVGDNHPDLMPDLFPYAEEVPESFFHTEHLAIAVDVGDRKRVSMDHLSFAKEVIKIDHHEPPVPELDFGTEHIVYPKRPAASELIALFALSRSKKRKLSTKAATYLYCGIVGDSGRFLYQDTDGATLRVAADLLDLGVKKDELYRRMYRTDARKLAILRYCLETYKVTDKGTCYFVFEPETMEKLNMTTLDGNLHINVFREMNGIRAVVSATYDAARKDYRVSVRSATLILRPAVVKFNGGGHDYAAGCHLKSLDQLPLLLEEIDKL